MFNDVGSGVEPVHTKKIMSGTINQRRISEKKLYKVNF